MKINCPSCSATLSAASGVTGRVACPSCKQRFDIPGTSNLSFEPPTLDEAPKKPKQDWSLDKGVWFACFVLTVLIGAIHLIVFFRADNAMHQIGVSAFAATATIGVYVFARCVEKLNRK